MLNNFFVIPVIKENTIVKPALAISAGTSTTLEKEIIDTPRLVADEKVLSI